MSGPKDPKQTIELILTRAVRQVAPRSAIEVVLERPRNPEHGDYSTPAAVQIAKPEGVKPRELAQRIVAAADRELRASGACESLSIEGPGFLNVRLTRASKLGVIRRALAEGPDYGRARAARPESVQVEFVSANPTGPLHVGHGRGAAYGASLASLLEFAGHRVAREFYVNDAGRQMDILALSVWLRYLQARGAVVPFPEEAYRGDYVRDIAARLAEAHAVRFERDSVALPQPAAGGDPEAALDAAVAYARALLGEDWPLLHGFALGQMLAEQREDLDAFRVSFDRWTSERSLYEQGLVERAARALAERGHAYEKDGALWFRSSSFGDEKDRVLRRENGQYTYFASDVAYHRDKFERGFERVIDVWGADHHGYVARLKGALAALGYDPARLTVALVQFAVLYRGGQRLAMGKRSGEFVTLRELREEVGNDAARFFYVLRKSDQHLDFDLDLARSESQENPVYYVQYAHARLCSVFAQWGGDTERLAQAGLAPLASARELALALRLAEFPALVTEAARELAPHSIAFYLRALAGELHSYYNAERILVEDEQLRAARLALCAAVRHTLANGLALLGVRAPEKM
jgi:arginyl-tRNA synthetase